ncbi:MAG: hypothetical protein ABSA45_05385 [Verrucomicrobiota bacterium]|jgi:hypothetical protein
MTATKFVTALAGAILVMGVLVPARAQDKKVDPTGTYIWTMAGRNGGPDRTNTLVLKLDGDKLTGKLTAPARGGEATATEISDGKITGADLSFNVTRTFNDNTMTNKYSGKLADGVIKGKIEFERNGDVQSRDWEAKLQK